MVNIQSVFARVRQIISRDSLRQRLLSSALIWMSLILLSAALFIPRIIENYFYSELRDQIEIYLDDISAYVDISPEGKPILLEPMSDPRFRKPYSGWYWQIDAQAGQLRSRSLWDTQLQLSRLQTGKEKGKEKGEEKGPDGRDLLYGYRQLTLGELDTLINATVAVDSESVEDTVEVLTGGILMALGAIAVTMLMLIWSQVRWSLKPMTLLQSDLQAVRDGKADTLKGQYPVEIQPVVNDLNVLLFQYTELLERARSHTGNLAHALKTPLSILHNEVEKLPQAQQQGLQPAVRQLQDRMNYHLGRARVAGAVKILAAQSCPADVVDNVSMALAKVYSHRDVVLVNELDDELMVGVDGRDLEEMLGNLIENAFKWSSGLIRVQASEDSGKMNLLIDDNGPGLQPEQWEAVLQRGVRMDEQTPGSGLGLNIVLDIAHTYQGDLTLSQSPMGGLQVRLVLPLPRNTVL